MKELTYGDIFRVGLAVGDLQLNFVYLRKLDDDHLSLQPMTDHKSRDGDMDLFLTPEAKCYLLLPVREQKCPTLGNRT